MDPRTLIANRIDLHLRRQLGTSLDCHRALTDTRYVDDVLLVCDAMQGTDLPLLARQFRVAGERMAQAARPGHDAGPPQGWAANTSGFGASQALPERDVAGQTRKPWFSPSRWF
ncbi:MAG: hypothetical protein V4792_19795 [Pseudomonadota bacterium]